MYGRKSIDLKKSGLLLLGLMAILSSFSSCVMTEAATVTTKAPGLASSKKDTTVTSSTTTTTRSPLQVGGRRLLANAGGKLVATNGWQHHYQIVDTVMIERMFGLFNDYLVCRYDGAANCDDNLVHNYEQLTGHRPEFLLKTHTLPAMQQPFQFMDNRHGGQMAHNGQMMQLPPWMPPMDLAQQQQQLNSIELGVGSSGVAGRGWMPFAPMPLNNVAANVVGGGDETPRLLMDQAAGSIIMPPNPNMPPNGPIQGQMQPPRPPMGDMENGPQNGPQSGGPRGGPAGGPQGPQPQPQGGRRQ